MIALAELYCLSPILHQTERKLRVECDKPDLILKADNDDHLPYEAAEEQEEPDKESKIINKYTLVACEFRRIYFRGGDKLDNPTMHYCSIAAGSDYKQRPDTSTLHDGRYLV